MRKADGFESCNREDTQRVLAHLSRVCSASFVDWGGFARLEIQEAVAQFHSPFGLSLSDRVLNLSARGSAESEPDQSEHQQQRAGYNQPVRVFHRGEDDGYHLSRSWPNPS